MGATGAVDRLHTAASARSPFVGRRDGAGTSCARAGTAGHRADDDDRTDRALRRRSRHREVAPGRGGWPLRRSAAGAPCSAPTAHPTAPRAPSSPSLACSSAGSGSSAPATARRPRPDRAQLRGARHRGARHRRARAGVRAARADRAGSCTLAGPARAPRASRSRRSCRRHRRGRALHAPARRRRAMGRRVDARAAAPGSSPSNPRRRSSSSRRRARTSTRRQLGPTVDTIGLARCPTTIIAGSSRSSRGSTVSPRISRGVIAAAQRRQPACSPRSWRSRSAARRRPASSDQIPRTIRDLLTARLDALDDGSRSPRRRR